MNDLLLLQKFFCNLTWGLQTSGLCLGFELAQGQFSKKLLSSHLPQWWSLIVAFPESIPHFGGVSIDMLYTGTTEQMIQCALGKCTAVQRFEYYSV